MANIDPMQGPNLVDGAVHFVNTYLLIETYLINYQHEKINYVISSIDIIASILAVT